MKRMTAILLSIVLLVSGFFRSALAYDNGGLLETEGSRAFVFRDGLTWVTNREGLYGCIDLDGNAITPFLYDRIYDAGGNHTLVSLPGGGSDILDETGESIFKDSTLLIDRKEIEYFEGFGDGLSRIEVNGAWYVIDEKGEPIPQEESYFCEGAFSYERAPAVDLDGNWGYINTEGKLAIPCQWSYAEEFSEGLAAVLNHDGQWGFINRKGDYLNSYRWTEVRAFCNGRAAVMDDEGKWGFINKRGEKVIACRWWEVGSFNENRAPVEGDGGWGFIDGDGALACECRWSEVGSFASGLAPVRDVTWGYINKYGTPVIECEWEAAGAFSEGRAAVADASGLYGFIDQTGELVIPCEWNRVGPFSEGLAWVEKTDGERGFIDTKGNMVIAID